MIARWEWTLKQVTKRLWFRASLFSLLGVVTALLALAFQQYIQIPDSLATSIGADAVDKILNIIASSMLTVTTFSLSIMVAAYGSATNNVTPRATRLLIEDSTTQNVLGTFIGAFLFSVVGIIALSTGAYGNKGRVLLFAVTLAVLVLIVYALLRWVDHLAQLGRVGETTDKVEQAATHALLEHLRLPHLGGRRLASAVAIPADARRILPERIGYVQHIDMPALAGLAADEGCAVFVQAVPGSFVDARSVLAATQGLGEDADARVRAAFSIGLRRSFEQDPRFGVLVLAEIASRALSPAVNDPGTAIDVIGRGVRLLSLWADPQYADQSDEQDCARVFVPELQLGNLFDDLFTPIARDGAAMVEVGVRLQKALASLAHLEHWKLSTEARRHSGLALKRAEAALPLEEDKQRLRALAEWMGAEPPARGEPPQ